MKLVYLVNDQGYLIHPERVMDDAELTLFQVATPPPPEARAPQWIFSRNEWTEGDDLPEVEPDARLQAPIAGEQLRADLDYLAMMTGVDL